MIFNERLGLEKIPDHEKIIYREAVRAVILNSDHQLVMIQSRVGDYSFPGGGINDGESQLETLRREASEEAGVVIKDDVQMIGVVVERRKSQEVEDAYFVMESIYYLCHAVEYVEPQLEEYEKEWGFTPIEVDIRAAYEKNLAILQHHKECPIWVAREIFVLKCLLAHQGEFLEMGGA